MKFDYLRILILEDLQTDADLMLYHIRKVVGQVEYFLAKNEVEYLEGLNTFSPKIILSDYLIPMLDGMKALELARQYQPMVPFVFVTGTLNNEELAAQTVLSGASEFILKNNLERLPEVLVKVLTPEFSNRQIHERFIMNKREVEQFKKEIEAYEQRLKEMKAALKQSEDKNS